MKWGSRLLIFGIGWFFLFSFQGQSQNRSELQTGDFLFLDLDCGPLCDAIEAVTPGWNGIQFSHVGMVIIRHDGIFLLEAIGKGVQMTPISRFLNYTSKPPVLARLNDSLKPLIPRAVEFIQKQMGKPYDDAFLPDNGQYYCSELLYDALKWANGGRPAWQLTPMTFRMPGSADFFPAWVEYFEKLGMPIPEGLPGCNPGGLLQDPAFRVVGIWKGE